MKSPQRRLPLLVATAFAILGIILLIVGIVLVVKSNKASCKGPSTGTSSGEAPTTPTTSPAEDRCASSTEAKKSGLDEFLDEVQNAYFALQPDKIVYKRPTTIAEIRKLYKPYDPSPANLKKITDKATELLYHIGNKTIVMSNLKPREKKALYQVKHYLKHIFATPYDGNYYAGDFLMGPNLFCWQPICSVVHTARVALRYFKPSTVESMELLRDTLAKVKATFHQYIENLKYGVRAGMVRSVEECRAGLDSFKRNHLNIGLKGPEGVFDDGISLLDPRFIAPLLNNTEEVAKWEAKYNKSVNESVRGFVLDYIGKPVYEVISYLETEHMSYCVPSNISSGLANLPVSYIYINGTSTGNKTTGVLPTGEVLNGKKSYEMIMPYFTTTDNTPDEVHALGYTMLRQLYPEVLEIAREVTELDNNDTAKVEFIRKLNESNMFFVEGGGEIPANESTQDAYNLCSTLAGAEKNCPHRWAAMQRWFNEARKVMSMLDPKTTDMFYFNGYKHTAPNCPVEMRPNLNPSSGAQSYQRSTSSCSRPAYYNIPFFLERPGPKFEEWSVNAHEARPGHHTQVQGLVEHFRDTCGGVISWLDSGTSYTAFTEGWGLYAENPLIARDTNVYENAPFQKYGMLKWQIWRALRLIVDTGLHYKGFTRDKALDFFAEYAWDTSDGAHKEVTRYQSDPGQATAYMIGQLHIIKLRNYAKEELGKEFNLKDFHFYLLSQGSAPLSYLESSIQEYVRCTLSKGKGEGCYDVLNPVAPPSVRASYQEVGIIDDDENADSPPEMPMPEDYF